MEALGILISFVGMLFFLAGYLVSIYVGFRRRFLWGIGMIFLPLLSQSVFVAIYGQFSEKWVMLFFGGLAMFVVGALVEQIPMLGILIILTVFGYAIFRLLKNSGTSIGFPDGVSTHAQPVENTEGIALYRRYFEELVLHEKATLGQWPGTTDFGAIRKAFGNTDLVKDIKQFNARYFANETKQLSTNQINWKNEPYQLFLEMMRKKYSLQPRTAIAILLYIDEESQYADYLRIFQDKQLTDIVQFMREIVLYDIYAEREPNFTYIRRLVADLGIPEKQARGLEQKYYAAKQDLKLARFERSLAEQTDGSYRPVEQQIKADQRLARIQATIGESLIIDPEAYHIVGPDYRRDSRIDTYYRASFSQTLSRAFDGHCCKCGEGMSQLEFDHFWLPKYQGGNFLMRSKTGLYVNNAIPLCRSCNSR